MPDNSHSNSAAAAQQPLSQRSNAAASQISSNDQATLYDQFGGDKKMFIFVEDFMEGVMADSELACHHRQFQDPEQMEMLKEKLCAYFKYKLDGSRFYIGRSMPDVHRNLGITDDLFDKVSQVFLNSLKKIKLKPKVF